MAGSLYCCKSAPKVHGKQLTLLIVLDTAEGAATEVRIYDSTAAIADAASARESERAARMRDVCSPAFDADVAVAAVGAAPSDRMIAPSQSS